MKTSLIIITLFFSLALNAQHPAIKNGPWAGNVELRNAVIFVEVEKNVKSVAVAYNKSGSNETTTVSYNGVLGKEFNPVKIELNGLDMNTRYNYSIIIDGKKISLPYKNTFITKELWQYRTTAPDFNFLAGSCAYVNEPPFDRPGKPYGGDSTIFETMAHTKASFNLWLGDAWYLRDVDYNTPWGLRYRISQDRTMPVLQKLMNAMPQYFVWDDHDFGPNNAGKHYILKEESRKAFMDYTLNPSYGQDGEGIYTKLSYSDVDIFMIDDRFFLSDQDMLDSIDGQPNPEKTFFGEKQLDWLKNSLVYSNATFKIVASGMQMLNPVSIYEGLQHYSYDQQRLLRFLEQQKINGVIFLTGDRHHSEIIKIDRTGTYPLYDITVSPLTSGVGLARGAEKNNPYRVPGTLIEEQNFGNISISGKKGERVLNIDFHGIKGNKITSWKVKETDLVSPK